MIVTPSQTEISLSQQLGIKPAHIVRGYVNVSQLLGLTLFLLSSETGDLDVDDL